MSIYRDKAFAEYWNERAGDVGEVYKRFVLDPLLFSELGSFKGKTVLELGCGNGYLAKKFLDEAVELRALTITLTDRFQWYSSVPNLSLEKAFVI